MSNSRYWPEPKLIDAREAPGNIIHQRWRVVIHQYDEKAARELAAELSKTRSCDLECFYCVADKADILLGEIVVHRELLAPEIKESHDPTP